MSVAAGTRLGPYEIVSPLGAGGMGEVWRAKDTRLEREVAVKILPAGFAANEQFRARFEREAKTISSLNHPNICTLFDVGRHEGVDYLVMELLEGESLADRIARGPLPLQEVLRYGQQIAEALDRAHRQGVVHRDLKPGNIMLPKSGAKLLDFGLAKAAAAEVSVDGATAQQPLTREGTIVGTFQYMSPEQLEGEEADARTDIFALGAVLYEMATGRRAFEGKTKTSLIAAIVSSQPQPVSQVQPLAPPALDHIIHKCLEKDRDDRWQSAHDIAEELKWVASAGSQAGVSAPLALRRKTREGILFGAVVLLLVTTAVLAWRAFRPPPFRPAYRSSLVLPSNLAYVSGPPAISRDGSAFVYSAPLPSGEAGLWLRRFDESASRPVPGATGGIAPFWSPDGRFLAYFGRRRLMKIPLAGGQPEVLAEISAPTGGTWNADGVILYAASDSSGLVRISSGGGEPSQVTDPKALGHRSHTWPSFLPDQKHFLFLARPAEGSKVKAGLWVGSLDSEEKPVFVVAADTNGAYVNGYLLYSRDGVLRAQRFDPRRSRVEGDPFSLAPVQLSSFLSSAYFAVSDSGALVYVEQGSEDLSELLWFDRQGKRLGAVGAPGYYWAPRLSHDDRRVAIDKSESSGNGDIWVLETTRPGTTRVTFNPANESSPHWRGDDRAIYHFLAVDRSRGQIVETPVTGGEPKRLTEGDDDAYFSSDVSPDGATLIVERVKKGTPRAATDLIQVSLATKAVTPYLATPAGEESARFSPDGRWVSYVSDESGKVEVYVQSFPIGGGKWQISTDGGSQPCWSRDGRELFYLSSDGKLMSVAIRTESGFEPSVPAVLFPVTVRDDTYPQYDVSRDGRFLVNSLVPRTGTPTTLISDWRRLFVER